MIPSADRKSTMAIQMSGCTIENLGTKEPYNASTVPVTVQAISRDAGKGGLKYVFIITEKVTGKKYILATSSSSETEDWIRKIRKVAQTTTAQALAAQISTSSTTSTLAASSSTVAVVNLSSSASTTSPISEHEEYSSVAVTIGGLSSRRGSISSGSPNEPHSPNGTTRSQTHGVSTAASIASAGTGAISSLSPTSTNLTEEFSKDDTTGKPFTINDFEIHKVLGKGKYGKVVLCSQKSTGKVYAIKIIQKDAEGDQDSDTLLETRILRTIRHPFIVGLHAAFQSPTRLYLVMDYVNGGELYFHVCQFGRFSEERVRFYAAEILLAMECLHGRGIIYRDLKLENLLLTRDGHVQVTDFGLSKTEDMVDNDKLVGTLEYLVSSSSWRTSNKTHFCNIN
jgi:tRNA A-37 threonylcarbamoyl transferase component Bud32